MKRLVLLVSSIALAAGAVEFDPNTDIRNYLNHIVPKFVRAFADRDITFFENNFDPDFREKEAGKTLTKAEALKAMKSMFNRCESVKRSLRILSTKAAGNIGIAMTAGHMELVFKAAKPTDKTRKIAIDMWEKQTWIKVGKVWKVRMIEETRPSKVTMDGRPYDPSRKRGYLDALFRQRAASEMSRLFHP